MGECGGKWLSWNELETGNSACMCICAFRCDMLAQSNILYTYSVETIVVFFKIEWILCVYKWAGEGCEMFVARFAVYTHTCALMPYRLNEQRISNCLAVRYTKCHQIQWWNLLFFSFLLLLLQQLFRLCYISSNNSFEQLWMHFSKMKITFARHT